MAKFRNIDPVPVKGGYQPSNKRGYQPTGDNGQPAPLNINDLKPPKPDTAIQPPPTVPTNSKS